MTALALPKSPAKPGFSGLVHSSTSDKRYPINAQTLLASGGCRLVDAVQYRVKKMKSAVITSARLIQNQDKHGFRYAPAFITMTYDTKDHHWHRRDVSNFIKHCREYFRRHFCFHKFQYTWVAELQERGVVHYHVIMWLPHLAGKKRPSKLPKPDEQGWWYKGMTEIKWAKNAIGYIAKYASKGGLDSNGHSFPKGTRLYGCGGLSEQSKKEYRFWRMPSYVRDTISPKLSKAPDSFDMRKFTGGFIDKQTGEFIASGYACALVNGKLHIVKKGLIHV